MPETHPQSFDGVSVVTKANVYFDAGVVSHTVKFADGVKKTLGVIRPGSYRFDTQAPENMAILDGACRVKQPDENDWTTYKAGQAFDVPANNVFDIAVDEGVCQYICSFG